VNPTSQPDQAVEVVDLTRHFGPVRAVDGLSFTVATGSLLALLGPNGAGKTTTVEICEGFQRPNSGTVRVLGLDPIRDQTALRPRVGVMLQAGGAHGSATTAEMLRLIARCTAHPLEPTYLLDMLGLSAAARTPVRRLSGGQAQRLSLAMALVGRPELLFLDEPTAGMDPQTRHLVWDLLRAARADGVTIVLTTHLMDEAELLADRVLIVDHGRPVAAGTPDELIGATNRLAFGSRAALPLPDLLAALPPGVTATEDRPGHYTIVGDLSPATVAAVTAYCSAVDAPVTELQLGRRSLDEVFLELTGREVRP
jgi:ABC-2 type transport system ATP-binding protein